MRLRPLLPLLLLLLLALLSLLLPLLLFLLALLLSLLLTLCLLLLPLLLLLLPLLLLLLPLLLLGALLLLLLPLLLGALLLLLLALLLLFLLALLLFLLAPLLLALLLGALLLLLLLALLLLLLLLALLLGALLLLLLALLLGALLLLLLLALLLGALLLLLLALLLLLLLALLLGALLLLLLALLLLLLLLTHLVGALSELLLALIGALLLLLLVSPISLLLLGTLPLGALLLGPLLLGALLLGPLLLLGALLLGPLLLGALLLGAFTLPFCTLLFRTLLLGPLLLGPLLLGTLLLGPLLLGPLLLGPLLLGPLLLGPLLLRRPALTLLDDRAITRRCGRALPQPALVLGLLLAPLFVEPLARLRELAPVGLDTLALCRIAGLALEALLTLRDPCALLGELTLLLSEAPLLPLRTARACVELGADLLLARHALLPAVAGPIIAEAKLGPTIGRGIEPADVARCDALGADAKPMLLQELLTRTGDPVPLTVTTEPPQRCTVAQIAFVIRANVVVAQIWRREPLGGDESPVGVGNVRVVVEAERCPPERALADAPLHPRRAPRRVGTPHPAISPDPASVVIRRPAKRIVRDPRPTELRELPVAIGVRLVVGIVRHEHVAVARVVVPEAVGREQIVEDLDARDRIALWRSRDVDEERVLRGGDVVVVRVRVRVVVAVETLRRRGLRAEENRCDQP